MPKEIIISGKKIEPGEKEVVRLNVARLPSGTVITIRVHVYRSNKPGPTVLVMGGVHGDEINGVEIVRRTIDTKLFDQLTAGTVIAIPLLNVYGFINFSRDTSDGKDVNRNFPGNMKGSLASRVAGTLTKKILPLIDFGIDFHTGGSSRYNFPQVRFSKGDQKAEELAGHFAAPYLIRKSKIANTLRKVAADQKKSIIVYEGGESLRFDGFSIQRGMAGLKRVLYHNKMLEKAPPVMGKSIVFNKTTWVRADRSGIFEWSQQSGCKVSIGEPLGAIRDPYGESEVIVKATREGYIIGHNNAPVVNQGDALFHIGYEVD